MESNMDVFDLLFIALFFTAVISLAVAAISEFRGRRERALGILRKFAICAGLYLAIVFLVSFTTPTRVLKVGDPQCSDDWCIAVEDVSRTTTGSVVSYAVTLRLSSRAKGRAQRENGVSVYLLDDRGRRYDPIPEASAVPLNTLLQPQESVIAKRVFELPAVARGAGLVVDHGGCYPGCFVIGENTWFHKPATVKLD